jgi:hypothetical protein
MQEANTVTGVTNMSPHTSHIIAPTVRTVHMQNGPHITVTHPTYICLTTGKCIKLGQGQYQSLA